MSPSIKLSSLKVSSLKSTWLLVFCLLFPATAFSAETFVAGVDYRVLETPARTDDPNTIEVREFFSYACPHCFRLDSIIHSWAKELPEDVSFVQTPSVVNKTWRPLAHAFYIAKTRDKLELMHARLMDAIHLDKQRLYSRDDLADFFADNGIGKTDFNKLYDSYTIRREMRRADSITRQLNIRGVPAIVVNGKYFADGKTAGDFKRLIKVIDFLIEKERREQK